MVTLGSLQQIFENPINPLPENPTLIESLTLNQIKTIKPIDQSSLTEIFGELHFKNPETSSSIIPSHSSLPPLSSSSPSALPNPNSQFENSKNHKIPSLDTMLSTYRNEYAACHKKSESFSSMTSESLHFCTEGLGFESCDDVEDLKNESVNDWGNPEKIISFSRHRRSASDSLSGELRRSMTIGRTFPPPISCIGRTGKPWVRFKSYRHDGRFVLKEIRIPTQEFLHACRKDGRLKLHFIQRDDDIPEVEEGELEGLEQLEETEGGYEEGNEDKEKETDGGENDRDGGKKYE